MAKREGGEDNTELASVVCWVFSHVLWRFTPPAAPSLPSLGRVFSFEG